MDWKTVVCEKQTVGVGRREHWPPEDTCLCCHAGMDRTIEFLGEAVSLRSLNKIKIHDSESPACLGHPGTLATEHGIKYIYYHKATRTPAAQLFSAPTFRDEGMKSWGRE